MSTQPERLRNDERARRFRTWTIIAITNVLSLVCMAWVLKHANLHRIWFEVRHMRWSWVCLAVLSDVAVYLIHGVRWRLLLMPVQRISYLRTIEAIYVGLFTNEVFPLRAGELIRCFLVSKTTDLPLSISFASALLERIFDGVWLFICFLICLRMGKLHGILVSAGYLLGGIIFFLSLVLGYAMYARTQQLKLIFGLAWPKWFNVVIDDLHRIGHSRYLYYSFLVSGAYLIAQAIPIYALVQANRLDLPWTASFIAMVLLRLSAVVPQAPGNLGSFQWVATRSLMMFGLERSHAIRFSLILWSVVTIPLIVVGFIAITMEGINMGHLQRQAASAAREHKNGGEPSTENQQQ